MFQDDLLLNKRILITGGGTGLGKASAQHFLELGAEIYICGRREDVLSATAEELTKRTGGKIHVRRCDVRDAAAVEVMIASIWADGPLDVLMNNAAGNFLARTEELSIGAFQSVIGIVLMGTLHTTLACGRRWLQTGRSAVVLNITTTYTETGSAYVVPSAVSKAGVQALTRSLAVEWGNRGIRMNAIAPGPIPRGRSRVFCRGRNSSNARSRRIRSDVSVRSKNSRTWRLFWSAMVPAISTEKSSPWTVASGCKGLENSPNWVANSRSRSGSR